MTATLPFLEVPERLAVSLSVCPESGASSSGSSSGSSGSSTGSSFSVHLSSGSDGGSDLSLLTSDVVLERLEKVEKVLVAARSTALTILFASYSEFWDPNVAVKKARHTPELPSTRWNSFFCFGPAPCSRQAGPRRSRTRACPPSGSIHRCGRTWLQDDARCCKLSPRRLRRKSICAQPLYTGNIHRSFRQKNTF